MTSIASRRAKPRRLNSRIVFLIFIVAVASFFIYSALPASGDWLTSFRPAALMMLHGQSPYTGSLEFYNPPWTLLIFIPFALLPVKLGQFGVLVLGFIGFAYITMAFKAKPVAMILFLTSMPVMGCLANGELDWLPMLSFVLPAPFALIFAAMKPQIGIGIALYWLVESWYVGQFKEVFRNFLPVSLLIIASFLLYGFWLRSFGSVLIATPNVSIFPYLVPFGLVLIGMRRKHTAIAANLCLSPYYTLLGLASPLVALFDYPKLMLIAWIVTWIYPLTTSILK